MGKKKSQLKPTTKIPNKKNYKSSNKNKEIDEGFWRWKKNERDAVDLYPLIFVMGLSFTAKFTWKRKKSWREPSIRNGREMTQEWEENIIFEKIKKSIDVQIGSFFFKE